MAHVPLPPMEWAQQQFSECDLGDERRNSRLVKVAAQMAERPDGTTPVQTETWGKCKATYRLFNTADVSFQKIAAPHYELTRQATSAPVMLLINDTTELDFGRHRTVANLGPTGNGSGLGFFLHSCLMVEPESGAVEGLAGQRIFYRKPKVGKKKPHGNTRRRAPDRESAVWGNLMDDVGKPPAGVQWIHVCDRGADDFEVFCRGLHNDCGFIIRAAQLNRKIMSPQGVTQSLGVYLDSLSVTGTLDVNVRASKKQVPRTAHCEVRFAAVDLPRPKVKTDWIRKYAPTSPLRLWVVEVRENSTSKGIVPLRWVLWVSFPVNTLAQAETAIAYYRRRPTIEDYHKAIKTGCCAEDRLYQTAGALERVTAVNCLLAVRLLQIKTLAKQSPERPAKDIVPGGWLRAIKALRPKLEEPLTVRGFLRALAGLGGHLGRKSDAEPGWITIWRGLQKLLLILRGIDLDARRKCG